MLTNVNYPNWLNASPPLSLVDNLESSKSLDTLPSNHLNQLVCVELSPLSKGIPTSQTMICLPSKKDIEDLKAHLDNLLNKGVSDCNGPVEAKHWDSYRKER